jgi:hypothetical protein
MDDVDQADRGTVLGVVCGLALAVAFALGYFIGCASMAGSGG